jgi:NAD+ kinase
MKIQSIGMVLKHHQKEAAELAWQLTEVLNKRNIQVYFCDESARAVRQAAGLRGASRAPFTVIKKDQLPNRVDLILVLGGDGTLLSVARLMKTKVIPILGVNMGTLGFLTEVKKEEVLDALHEILTKKKLKISLRQVLQVQVKRGKKTIFDGMVVNDAVISKGAIARIIGVKITVDGCYAQTIRADGVIVSTPTGSTAYSLAAGGPIVMPEMECMVLTPICPHGLTQRSLILSDKSTVELSLDHSPGHVYLTLDGQEGIDLQRADVIEISRFKKHKLKIVSAPNRDYFMLLREKLKFGEK